MRKQERKVLENAIKTVNIVIEHELEKETVDIKFCKIYLDDTINDLKGYASIQYRFAGMKKKDFDEFFTTIEEFDLLMIDKIYN